MLYLLFPGSLYHQHVNQPSNFRLDNSHVFVCFSKCESTSKPLRFFGFIKVPEEACLQREREMLQGLVMEAGWQCRVLGWGGGAG